MSSRFFTSLNCDWEWNGVGLPIDNFIPMYCPQPQKLPKPKKQHFSIFTANTALSDTKRMRKPSIRKLASMDNTKPVSPCNKTKRNAKMTKQEAVIAARVAREEAEAAAAKAAEAKEALKARETTRERLVDDLLLCRESMNSPCGNEDYDMSHLFIPIFHQNLTDDTCYRPQTHIEYRDLDTITLLDMERLCMY